MLAGQNRFAGGEPGVYCRTRTASKPVGLEPFTPGPLLGVHVGVHAPRRVPRLSRTLGAAQVQVHTG